MKKPSLRQIAYEQILQWIEKGDFPRGSVTSELKLSERLDMSRTPVRAALQQLELEGYIRIAAKHGILILDSSSQRVSDLLESIVSAILFSVTASWSSKQEDICKIALTMSDRLQDLLANESIDAVSLIAFEYELLSQWVNLANNQELSRAFQTAVSRLFWSHNHRRWQAPYTSQTAAQVRHLLSSGSANLQNFQGALFAYLQTLKLTWQ